MKNRILRWIYNRYTNEFNDLLVESYIKNMPEKLVYDGFDVIREHKNKFQKLTNYLAYELHRKMANDVRNSERFQGMFIQLKMFNHMISTRPEFEEVIPVKPVDEEKENKYNDYIDKAANFAKKFTK